MTQTLFFKDSVLFISKDGKEYEVSNPEEALRYFNNAPIESIDNLSWPGGVEFIFPCRRCDKEGGVRLPCIWDDCKAIQFARLLPKEKKIYNPALSGYKPESDYKQFEGLYGDACPKCGHMLVVKTGGLVCENQKCNSLVESSEPQEKGELIGHIIDDFKNRKEIFVEPVPAPVESQEELWLDVAGVFIAAGYGDAAHNHLLRTFSITRLTP